MTFKVKRSVALQNETDRVQSILLKPTNIRAEWTPETLQALLLEIGLPYTDEEIEAINGELHARDIVEDTG